MTNRVKLTLPWMEAVTGEVSIDESGTPGRRLESASIMMDTRGMSSVEKQKAGFVRDELKKFMDAAVQGFEGVPASAQDFVKYLRKRPVPSLLRDGIRFRSIG